MILTYFLGIYLVTFLIGIILSVKIVPQTHKFITYCLIVVVIACLGLGLVLSTEFMGGLLFAAFLISIFMPLATIFGGFFLGLTSKLLFIKNRKYTAIITGILSILMPSYLLISQQLALNNDYELRTKKFEKFQQTTITGKLENIKISFPASPQLETIHRCTLSLKEGLRERDCRTTFRRSGENLKNRNEKQPDSLKFSEITLFQSHDDCIKFNDIRYQNCLTLSELSQWCEKRAELMKSIWCNKHQKHKITFKKPLTKKYSIEYDAKRWIAEPLYKIDIKTSKKPIQIECSSGRDKYRNSIKGTVYANNTNRVCRLQYFVSKGIIAEIIVDNYVESSIQEEFELMVPYTNDVWKEITRTTL